MNQKRVIIESPYAGSNDDVVQRNIKYARRAMNDSLKRGEAPFLSHLLYTQVLDDTDPVQRFIGIEAGLSWGEAAEATVVYCDFGISRGMELGIQDAENKGRPVIKRYIGKNGNRSNYSVFTIFAGFFKRILNFIRRLPWIKNH